MVVLNMFYFHPDFGEEMIQFDEHTFLTGWFNHQLEIGIDMLF